MLAPKRSREFKELMFFISFITDAINGKQVYLDIIKPIILHACDFKKNKIPVYQLNREYLSIVLFISNFPKIKLITEDNLLLPELKDYIENNMSDI